jgi:spore coat protein U-like protein
VSRRTIWCVVACAGLGLAPRAEAACTVSASAVSFGSYSVYAAGAATSTATVTYNCGNKDKNIEIDLSAGSSGSFTTRTLKQGTDALNYNLYTDAALTNIWGDGTGGTDTYTKFNPANGVGVNVTIYGRVPPLQDVRVGAYTDSIVATINF